MTAPQPPEADTQHVTYPSGATPGPAAPPAAQPRRLSLFLKVSIVLLAALSIAAISLLFIGDFDGKFVRIFSTFVIFAIFVLFTALDTRLDQRSSWYAPVALIANSYILALALIVSWMTPYEPFFLGWDIFWKTALVIIVTRVVILCCQLLLGMGIGKPQTLGAFAFITSVLAVVSGILFTAPIAIETFTIIIPELYWKFAVAALLLTALGLAITLLLRWSYGAPDREAARQQRELEYSRRVAQQHQMMVQVQHGYQFTQAYPASVPGAPAPTVAVPSASEAPGTSDAAAGHLLPWPTFADGSPLPAGPDGQPDFTALGGQARG